ncbi:hypothetical protein [Streptomyces phaeofaciens]|uniref:hypothetical protein n=1 Tax=Streptomyces phaeofaciens TaxID=68254 RepID=UPI0036CDE83D
MNVNDTTSARHRARTAPNTGRPDRRGIDADLPVLHSEAHASRENVLNIPAA